MLMEAFAGALEDVGRDSGRLVIVGDGPMRPLVERLAADLGVRAQVELTGWQGEADVRRRLLESRCLVLTSAIEGLPVVIMEALALGRPVIATCVGGIPELVRPDENGWLVPAGSVIEARRAIARALTLPPEQLNAMGTRGRRAVLGLHCCAHETAKLEALLRRYVEENC
jgi:glycosyltransferase involved in cell wall biosynthesis